MKEGRKERLGSMKTDRVGREGGGKRGEGSEEERKGEDEEGGGILRGRDSLDSPVGVLLRYRRGTVHCTLMCHV